MTTAAPPQLASFRELRELAGASEHISALIRARKHQMAALGWDVLASPEASAAMRGKMTALQEFGNRRAETLRFFRHPDADYRSFSEWLGVVAEDLLVIDAAPVRLRKTRDGKRIASLSLLDGATVEPQFDTYGRLTGYRQYLSDIPRRTFADIASCPPLGCTLHGTYVRDEVLYISVMQRREAPFGFSPLEQAITRTGAGVIDLDATAERLTLTAGGPWMDACRHRLRDALFNPVLGRFSDDLHWEWES